MYRMLIVDDEKIERTGLCGLVRRFGYPFEIFQAANGKQAVQLLGHTEVDVLITDIRMPLMDGLELTDWVRKNRPAVHVVIASAYGDFAYAQKAISMQVRDYLLKPVDLAQFQTMMEHVQALCEADRQEADRARELEEYHRMKREQALWDLLFLPPEKELTAEAAAYYEAGFGQHWVTPVLAETHDPFFGTHEEEFTKQLAELWPWPCEVLVTEENQAVALVHGARPVPDEALEAAALKLLEKLRRLTRREVFFTVGPPAQGPRQLAASVQEAEERSEYKFFADAGMVVFSKEGYLAAADLNTVVDGLTRSLMEDIHYAAFEKAAGRLELLFKTLEQNHSLSVLYVKNLMAEALRKAAGKARPPLTADERDEVLRAVMAAPSLYELKEHAAEQLRAMGERTGDEERQTAAHRAVNEAIAMIREQYAVPALSMEYIAKKTYLSPSYFSAVFKAETGESATHFLARYRLERARELLEGTNTRIADIGARVGFSSASYFVTVFRGAYGMSPSQYREQHA